LRLATEPVVSTSGRPAMMSATWRGPKVLFHALHTDALTVINVGGTALINQLSMSNETN